MSGVRRISLKELNIHITNALVVGVIIGNRTWRKFASITKNERAVWSFTMRGSPENCINVVCWGSPQFIQTMYNSYHVGDVVNIIKPQIKPRNPGDRNETFLPLVNSPFELVLNEGQSIIQLHDGDDISAFADMLNIPTKKLTRAYTLYDIQTNGSSMRGQQVDILVGVRLVGPIKTVKTKNQNEVEAREIIVMDQTNPGFSVTLWEDDEIMRASDWIPRETVLFITDVRIEIRKNVPAIVLTSQTIITVNPDDSLAKALRGYMKNTAPMPIPTRSFVTPNISLPNPQFIKNVISIAQLNKKIETLNSNPDMEVNFTGQIFCFIVDIDLEPHRVTIEKWCGICNTKIDPQLTVCFHSECPVGSGSEPVGPIKKIDIVLSLADHTGSIQNVHFQDKSAEDYLKLTPEQFERLPKEAIDKIKWNVLLERCEVKLMLVRNVVGKIQVNILTHSLTEDYGDVAQKLPLF